MIAVTVTLAILILAKAISFMIALFYSCALLVRITNLIGNAIIGGKASIGPIQSFVVALWWALFYTLCLI